MQIMIANNNTGEVISWTSEPRWSNAAGLKCMRGYIRQWVKNGMYPLDFEVLTATGHAWLDDYLFDYCVDEWLDFEDENELEEEDDDISEFLELDDFDDDDWWMENQA